MKKTDIFIAISAAAFLALAGYYLWQNGYIVLDPQKNNPIENIQPGDMDAAAGKSEPKLEEKEINEAGADYTVSVKYPVITGLNNAKAEQDIAQYIQDKIKSDTNEFKKNVSDNSVKGEDLPDSQLMIGYEKKFADSSFISIIFTTFYYVAGMAHPATYETGFNYDIQNGKQLAVADFFNPGSDFLSVLSIASKEEIKKQTGEYYDQNMAEEGAAPDLNNFNEFYFDKDNLTIIFQQYQVAPYAAGIIYASLPYSKMSEVNDKSPVVIKLKSVDALSASIPVQTPVEQTEELRTYAETHGLFSFKCPASWDFLTSKDYGGAVSFLECAQIFTDQDSFKGGISIKFGFIPKDIFESYSLNGKKWSEIQMNAVKEQTNSQAYSQNSFEGWLSMKNEEHSLGITAVRKVQDGYYQVRVSATGEDRTDFQFKESADTVIASFSPAVQ